MKSQYTILSILAFLIFSISSANAYTFTWNGSSDVSWTNSSNWTRTGSGSGNTTPGASDDVVINNGSASNQPELSGNQTVSNFTMSAGSIILWGNTFTVTNNASFTGGTMKQGWLDAKDFTNLQNTTFDAANGVMVINKTGGSNNDVFGNNTFKGPLATLNSSASRFRLSVTQPDKYEGYMHYEERSTGALEPAYNGINIYPNDFSTLGSTNVVSFGLGTGTCVFTGYTTVVGGQFFVNRVHVNTTQSFNFNGNLVTNTFRLLSGSVDFNANTLTVNNNARILGGSIEDGTFEFDDLDTMQNAAFTDVTIIKNSGGADNTVRGGNTFNGNITIRNNSNADLNMANVNGDDFNGNVLFLEMSSGQLNPAKNGNNTFAGNISTVSSSNAITFGSGTGVVIIDGNQQQYLSGDVARTPIYNRFKLNTTGEVSSGGSAPLIIAIQGDFTKGYINSSAFNLVIFNDNATVVNVSNAGHVNGPVRKIGNDVFVFPVGNGSVYAGIGITAPTNTTDHFTAEYFWSAYGDLSVANSGIDHVSTYEYWDLDRSGGSSNVKVTLYYNSVQRSGTVNNTADLIVAHFNGSDWESMGNVTLAGGSNNTSGSIQTNSAVTNFSPFTLGSSSSLNPLPITLINFKAVPVNTEVLVKWTTMNETNNDFFTIERSVDGKNWINIGNMDGADNSEMTMNYQMIDHSPVQGLQFYRLKQTDINGLLWYSSLSPVRFGADAAHDVVLYPQPANEGLNISIQNNENSNVQIALYNALGQKLIEMNDLSGSNFLIDLSSLSSGIYYLELNLDGVISKSKVIKQ